jgi:hypothetical protein
MQCKAKSKQSGKQCRKAAVPGMEVCRFHGGATPVGAASPHFKHGRYSKHLPAGLVQRYHDARKDPDLLALRDDISLIDVRLAKLVEALPEGGASHSWGELQQAWQELLSAQRRGDEGTIKLAFGKLGEIISEGSQEANVWLNIERTLETRRRLTASEAKRLTDMQQVITYERAIALILAIVDVVRRNVQAYEEQGRVADRKLMASIGASVRGLISSAPPSKNE